MEGKLDNAKLIVNYLPHALTEEGLKSLFEAVGPVESVKLMRNQQGESLAYGFVNFKSPDDGLRAIATLNGVEREGKTMKVSVAKPKFLRETTNLYVADLPTSATETQVREVFEQYGEVNNCKLVVNQETGLSRGVAFILFHHAHEAEAAIQALNGQYVLGSSKPVTVKIKDEPKSHNPDLYVANVPKAMDEDTLRTYFSAYGQVRTCKIVRDTNTQASKGIAFVHFAKRKESDDAIAGLHDTRLPGSTQNLIVKPKEAKEDKNAGAAGLMGGASDASHHAMSAAGYNMQQQHDWSGYGYGYPPVGAPEAGYTREEMVTSPNGEVKRVIHHYVNVPAGAEMSGPGGAAGGNKSTTPGAGGDRENGGGPMRRLGTYGTNRYNPTSAARPEAAAPPPPPPAPYGYPPAAAGYPHHPGGRFSHEDAKAQPSHQLFVYNLGAEANEVDLYDLFAPFGAVTKVYPMRDKESNQCKGFGFVEMPCYESAVLAIAALNGMPFAKNGNKMLKVDFKTQKSKS